MKKLVVIALVYFMISLSVNAKKDSRIFKELTRTMLVTEPIETVKYQNSTASYWKIETGNGGFYYLTAKQEFHGKYKSWNFNSTINNTTISGVKKHKRHVKKDLRRDIISSQYQ